MKKIVYIFIFSVLVSTQVFSQYFGRRNAWKKERKEVFYTVGVANFLGDLGGRDATGSDYSPADLELHIIKSAYGLGYKYKMDRWLNVSGKFSYLKVEGSDEWTKDIYRNNRNLSFKSNIFELAGRIELGWQNDKIANRYGIKKTFIRRMKDIHQGFFLFTGVGVFYFNPKAKAPDGKYMELRKLRTEGQGLPNGPDPYSNYSICVPFGANYKVTFHQHWAIGLEISWRKTFTDYIDDVGSYYYDKRALEEAYGPLSAQMSDRSLGNVAGATDPDAAGNPAQRGDKQKDSYLSFEVSVGYIFVYKRRMLRSKF